MGAIFRHELRNYFHSLTAYVFGAFLLAVVGLGSVLYNLQAAVSNFEFVLSFASIIFVVIVPILTMRTLAEERRQRTDQLLYSLPITTTQVVLGKYFALLVVYLIPLAVVSLYPLLFSQFGEVYLPTSYGSLFAFFMMGAALLAAIEASKSQDLSRLIFALGIRQVGEKAAKVLARRFGTMQALSQATEEELTSIDDVGPITAAYIRQWMESPQSRDLLRRLEDAGVNMSCKEELVDNRFAGMAFVLTGSLERFTREEAGQMIEQRGGKSASSVSKKTSYVVAGPGAGSKLRRAQELNIPVLTEDEFLELLK